MAPNRGHNRAKDFEAAIDAPPRDFDPEVDDAPDDVDDSDAKSDDGEELHDARDHYVSVEKSKLRKPKTAALGPQYRGSRVARDAIDEDEEEDDPFSKGFGDVDEEEDSEDDSAGNGFLEDEDVSGSDGSEEEAMPVRSLQPSASQTRAEVLKEAARDQEIVATSLAQSIKADAEKGQAVKKQKAAFDSLLNTRIRLQKAMVGSNTMVVTPREDLAAHLQLAENALENAEQAAFALWSNLNRLRDDMTAARTGEKRKRSFFDSHSSVDELWSHMQIQEKASLPHRNATLQRWSGKAQAVSAMPDHGIINKSASQPTIIDVLQEYLSNRDHLLKRAHTPRSCAPVQVARGEDVDDKIYDDADFYGILLKELLDQRSSNSVAAANVDYTSGTDLRRAAKAKKNVDTKASKGRKLRYTVHEKLQNFMAPEDRTNWSDRQADELFGSLFGQRLGLGENRDENAVNGDEVGDESGRLMLFGK